MTLIRVSEVMSRNPIKAESSLSAEEGARIMSNKGISSLLIEEGEKIIGIVTERDMVTKIAAKGLLSGNIKLKEIMSSPLVLLDG